jgi:phosphohistidine phosphatase SixA
MFFAFCVIVASVLPASSAETASIIDQLKQGGYAIVFRHTATDDSQKDVTPFRFDDMKAQRQLSDKGRADAKALGVALKDLGIPIGVVYTSQLNRAIETGKLISNKDVEPKAELTDSSAGSTSGMANPDGSNAKAGQALRNLLMKTTGSGDILYITHKTNVSDAFGRDFADVSEGEALVVKIEGGQPVVKARVKPSEWAVKPRS